MFSITAVERKAKVLDFDTECRPLAWYGGDWVTKQPTAIAWAWEGQVGPPVYAYIGGSNDTRKTEEEERLMLAQFTYFYDKADIVTGHFIRGFDLSVINGALVRLGMAPLGPKLTSDTKLDFNKASGISKSQENLGAMYELEHPKVPMNTTLWARANMLTVDGIKATIERVKGDVAQHLELRAKMVEQGVLAAPRMWTPESSGLGGYSA